eukprot:4899095-Pleurochrysis_carterae.AAC.4
MNTSSFLRRAAQSPPGGPCADTAQEALRSSRRARLCPASASEGKPFRREHWKAAVKVRQGEEALGDCYVRAFMH